MQPSAQVRCIVRSILGSSFQADRCHITPARALLHTTLAALVNELKHIPGKRRRTLGPS
jgi:hypothetical protein